MKVVFVSAALALLAAPALADSDRGVAPKTTIKPVLTFRAYGEMHAAFYAYGPDQNRDGGSQRDRRVELDTTRLALELEAMFPGELEVEGEIEFEHGGTGSAFEIEYDEFGEFEKEVEKGGEAQVEELFVRKVFGGRYALTAGRFYVAMGLLSRYNVPTSYLGTARAEGETVVIPAVWHEMGVQGEAFLGRVKLTAQLVNGLDSTGFSSQRWVAGGHQGRFETVRATDLAGVVRADVTPTPGVETGVSAYVGGTSRDRPKADLVPDCPDGWTGAVAPCGYTQAPLVIVDAHAAVQLGHLRGQAMGLWGHLGNAEAVSARNERLSNEADVPRTPVSDQALVVWGELGYDIAPLLQLCDCNRLEPFVRLEHYDSIFRPRDDLFDNPRFSRTVASVGASYQWHGSLFAKLDVSRRTFAGDSLRPENALRVAGGFVF